MDWTDIYPRPQLRRQKWQSLCGDWLANGQISYVPACRTEEDIFYQKSFDFVRENDIVLLHFGAADQIADVRLNGVDVGIHQGGYLPFTFDISDIVVDGVNILEVHVQDRLSHEFPYGKQKKKRGGMWYTPMSGLWQSVWIEQVPEAYIRSVRITPDLKSATIDVECPCEAQIKLLALDPAGSGQISRQGENHPETGVFSEEPRAGIQEGFRRFRFDAENPHLWSPEDPFLYRAEIIAGKDCAEIYFALRTVEINEAGGINRVCLNGRPVFLNGVLDQGYFSPGLMLPPDPDEYSRDILRMKELGFNLLRKHIKIEPELFYYECDRLGMLVMQDMVNSGGYSFFRDTVLPTIGIGRSDLVSSLSPSQRFFTEHCAKTVELLYDHPCIIAWTIFNEGWGQFNSDDLYARFKVWDPTRLIDSTSGWFRQKNSDFDSRHIYFRTPEIKAGGKGGRPLFISECGGYSLELGGHGEKSSLNPGPPERTYGYGGCRDTSELTDRIEALYGKMIIPAIPLGCCGLVYTQLSDIEDEINGLYSYDRTICKVDKERMRALTEKIKIEEE